MIDVSSTAKNIETLKTANSVFKSICFMIRIMELLLRTAFVFIFMQRKWDKKIFHATVSYSLLQNLCHWILNASDGFNENYV